MILNYLNKRNKIMRCVIDLLGDLYGTPTWIAKPKQGQDPERIIKQWVKELGDYSESALELACYNHYRYKKTKTFPTISHIKAGLNDDDKVVPKPKETVKRYFSVENELMEKDILNRNCRYTKVTYKRAVEYLLTKGLKKILGEDEYREIDSDKLNGYMKKYELAMDNGLFVNFHNTLDFIASGGEENEL